MKTIDNIKKWADKFENKTAKIIAFYGAVTGFIALFPTIIAIIVWMYFFFVDLFNISNYVKEFRQATEYNHFMIMQLTHMIEAEADPKESFGIPVRMTNVPEGHRSGDLYYFTYIKINGDWRPIIYGAFPNKTKKNVGILDMNGKYRIAGTEKKPLHHEER